MRQDVDRTSTWEEWPSGRDATTWRDGQLVEMPLEEWGATAGQFMGCGFRVFIPAVGGNDGPFQFAQASAMRVAELFGQQLDTVAWDSVAKISRSVVVEGGWEYQPNQPFGPPWTRASEGGRTHPDARIVRAVRLPWTWSSDAPTASLPMISGLEAGVAERHLQAVGAGIGLWFNHRDELCMSTAGPVLVQTATRSWMFPDRAAGMISNWGFFQIANRVGALPATIHGAQLAESLAVCSISGLANVQLIESIDGVDSSLDLDHVASLMRVRREVLAE